jgi:tetratricopeptide (TPR) repeat protein
MVVLALVAMASAVDAKPKRRDAKTWFDRGVAAYKKGSFEAASEALGKSFDLERDVDTLFAWAQSERKLEHCEEAIELYQKLLTFDLPAANKEAVDTKLQECRTIVAQQKPGVAPPAGASSPEPLSSAPKAAPTEEPPGTADHVTSPSSPVTDARPGARAWYKNPISLALVGSGAVATGVGVGFLVSAKSLDSDFQAAKDYQKAQDLSAQAKSHGNIGLIATGVGGALLIGGAAWIFTHRGSTEQHTMTGWLAPGGGGLAIAGSF